MAKFEVPGSGGEFFALDASGQAIVWLPTDAQLTLDFVAPAGHGADTRSIVASKPTLAVTVVSRNSVGLRFSIKASAADAFKVQGQDAHGHQTTIGVYAGDFKNHPGMEVDLLAKVCRTGDALKILRIQQILFDQPGNIFNQKSKANLHKFGSMMCGAVAKGRALELFGDINVLDYTHPYPEPLGDDPVSSRSELRYRSDIITKVRQKIVSLLTKGTPVRIGVLDRPDRMTPHNHMLIAWEAGGHTVVIVGCDKDGKNFMYLDPWFEGSKFAYAGGIGKVTPFDCNSMGIFTGAQDLTRKVDGDPVSAPNLLLQRPDSYGSFCPANENVLEVVVGPSI